jgi:D-alanyl-lipoteichoic acid acyltransferase DltB (MBOAT superfamily)
MLFQTPIFWVFFVVVYLGYVALLRTTNARLWLLLVASLCFYGSWNPVFVPLLLFSIAVDFLAGRAMPGAAPRRKRLLLLASLGVNLGALAAFKYANFFSQSMLNPVFAGLDLDLWVPELDILLPVGISFYTFQSMSYTIDVYRGQFAPRKDFLRFATSIAFFPQLVAGPIVRAAHLVPQMESGSKIAWASSRAGLVLIVAGLFKKTIADLLSRVAEAGFDGGAGQSLVETWSAVLAFAGQIYCDFAGYTDIAIGLGLMMGFSFPRNFDLPYIATSPIDFWRRWHISLSSWLRDYLYIPLGGRLSRYRNLLITMMLGGLWHGASYTFLVWGCYHGVLLMLAHGWREVLGDRAPSIPRPVRAGFTFYLVLVGWVFFRADSIDTAWEVLARMHGSTLDVAAGAHASLDFALVVTALVLSHVLDWAVLTRRAVIERPFVFWPALVSLFAAAMLFGGTGQEFIYFRF